MPDPEVTQEEAPAGVVPAAGPPAIVEEVDVPGTEAAGLETPAQGSQGPPTPYRTNPDEVDEFWERMQAEHFLTRPG